MIEMACPHCKQDLHIPDEYSGAVGRCNKCGGRVTVAMLSSLVPGGPFFGSPPTFTYDVRKGEELILAAGRGRREEV